MKGYGYQVNEKQYLLLHGKSEDIMCNKIEFIQPIYMVVCKKKKHTIEMKCLDRELNEQFSLDAIRVCAYHYMKRDKKTSCIISFHALEYFCTRHKHLICLVITKKQMAVLVETIKTKEVQILEQFLKKHEQDEKYCDLLQNDGMQFIKKSKQCLKLYAPVYEMHSNELKY